MSGNKDNQEGNPARPEKQDEAGAPRPRPREISREEMDHQLPADADPDDPVSP